MCVRVFRDVNGFDTKVKYACTFTDSANKNVKKITDASFVDGNKYKLDCGAQPAGFKISLADGIPVSRVTLQISVKGTTNVASYIGKVGQHASAGSPPHDMVWYGMVKVCGG